MEEDEEEAGTAVPFVPAYIYITSNEAKNDGRSCSMSFVRTTVSSGSSGQLVAR